MTQQYPESFTVLISSSYKRDERNATNELAKGKIRIFLPESLVFDPQCRYEISLKMFSMEFSLITTSDQDIIYYKNVTSTGYSSFSLPQTSVNTVQSLCTLLNETRPAEIEDRLEFAFDQRSGRILLELKGGLQVKFSWHLTELIGFTFNLIYSNQTNLAPRKPDLFHNCNLIHVLLENICSPSKTPAGSIGYLRSIQIPATSLKTGERRQTIIFTSPQWVLTGKMLHVNFIDVTILNSTFSDTVKFLNSSTDTSLVLQLLFKKKVISFP